VNSYLWDHNYLILVVIVLGIMLYSYIRDRNLILSVLIVLGILLTLLLWILPVGADF